MIPRLVTGFVPESVEIDESLYTHPLGLEEAVSAVDDAEQMHEFETACQ